MEYLRHRVSNLEHRINLVKNPKIRYDLIKMLHNINSMVDDISREAVEIRRLNCIARTNNPTAKFQKLDEEIKQSFHRLEKYITLYSLL